MGPGFAEGNAFLGIDDDKNSLDSAALRVTPGELFERVESMAGTPMALAPARPESNAALARRLAALAQQLQAKGDNPFKIRAYRRAAETIAGLPDSIDEQVRAGADLTQYPGIGKGIAAALRELVLSGTLGQLEKLLVTAPPEIAALNKYPRLDPKRVKRAYKKLQVSTPEELQERLASGEIAGKLGAREEHHFRQAFTTATEILLDDAEPIARNVEEFLLKKCGATRAEIVGSFRRRVEVVSELSFLVEVPDFAALVQRLQRYGGGAELVSRAGDTARLKLSDGLGIRVQNAPAERWGVALIAGTGSEAHLQKLAAQAPFLKKWTKPSHALKNEAGAYGLLGLPLIPPELREGIDEVELAARNQLPQLVTLADIRGELHAHTTSSDGSHSIEEMADAARRHGYDYLGVTDHSQSLKIAGGVSEDDLWRQIRRIDQLNKKGLGIRLLKSAEVDILADGSLDYPNALLAELDYTVCSIHSRFRLGKTEQTERLLRAMDNPYFTILGHTTGRLLLKRPG
ncbi:MAG: hypothetical protein JWM35_275 [Verrucomicrobia bacterium]|nr:hypothetical protein [Verrucomicrobiota bacterium]